MKVFERRKKKVEIEHSLGNSCCKQMFHLLNDYYSGESLYRPSAGKDGLNVFFATANRAPEPMALGFCPFCGEKVEIEKEKTNASNG